MKLEFTFVSNAFGPEPDEALQVNTGRFGARLARYLAEQLPQAGFEVSAVRAEDWGWRIDVQNADFPSWIGCGNQEASSDAFVCFVEPAAPFVHRKLRRVATRERVNALAIALEGVLRASGRVDALCRYGERS